MCDFQFLPIRKHPTATHDSGTVYEDLVPRLIPTTLHDTFSWWTHKESDGQKVPTFLPPYIFSRYANGVQTKILMQESDKALGNLASTAGVHGQSKFTF